MIWKMLFSLSQALDNEQTFESQTGVQPTHWATGRTRRELPVGHNWSIYDTRPTYNYDWQYRKRPVCGDKDDLCLQNVIFTWK